MGRILSITLLLSSMMLSFSTPAISADQEKPLPSTAEKEIPEGLKKIQMAQKETLVGNDLVVEPDLVNVTPVVQGFEGAGTITFNDSNHGFTLKLPDSWDLEEGFSDENLDFVVVGVSPEEGPNDPFIENMNVLVEKVGDKISLNQYYMWNLIGLLQELPNFHVHEKTNVTVNGIKMSRMVYSWDLNHKRTATYQYIFVRGDNGYVITFSADPEKFVNLRKMFDAIADSFQFSNVEKK